MTAVPLATSFHIDPREPWVAQHNREARDVWAAHKADRPVRVPVLFTGARTVYLAQNGIDYRSYYEDPEQMLRLQLEWNRLERELPLGDTVLAEAPDTWTVAVDFHPVASAVSLGCPVVFRPDAVPAHACAHLTRDHCRDMDMPDVLESGLLPQHRLFRAHFDRVCAGGLKYLGRPVARGRPTLPSTGGGTFSTALDARGPEIMSDMYDDPEFVHSFLERIAEWQIDLRRAWHRLDEMPYWMDVPGDQEVDITDHGIDMLSAETYDEFVASLVVRIARKYGKRTGTSLHHCGRGVHLFPLVKRRFGLTQIHGLTWPINNVARVRREVGHDVWIVAVISDAILRTTPDAIRQATRDFLTPEVKGRGRLSLWVPGEVTGIPVENYRAVYEAAREYGRY